jgi:hypothetical protein
MDGALACPVVSGHAIDKRRAKHHHDPLAGNHIYTYHLPTQKPHHGNAGRKEKRQLSDCHICQGYK